MERSNDGTTTEGKMEGKVDGRKNRKNGELFSRKGGVHRNRLDIILLLFFFFFFSFSRLIIEYVCQGNRYSQGARLPTLHRRIESLRRNQ